MIELRLNAIKQFKDKDFADALVKRAQQKRKDFAKAQQQLKTVELDYLFMHEIHALIDAELVELGEKFYLPVLRDLWKNKISNSSLRSQILSHSKNPPNGGFFISIAKLCICEHKKVFKLHLKH